MTTREQIGDTQLVRQSISGDHRAFEEIVRRHLSPVSAVAYALTGDRCLSEDVTQEVFITAWKRLKDLREPAKLRSWLCVIAQNTARTFGRKMACDPLHRASDLDHAYHIAAGAPSPAEEAMIAEQQRLVWSAIEKIPENYRVPLVLYYREGQSVADVGSALELSDETVRQRLSRARSMLRGEVAGLIESSLSASRPATPQVAAIMVGIAAGTIQATAATAASAAAAKFAGGTATTGTALTAAMFAAILGPLQILGGVLRARQKYCAGQTPAERRHLLTFLLQVPGVTLIFGICHVFLVQAANRGLLSDMQSLAAMAIELGVLATAIWLLHRRHRHRYYTLLKSDEANLNQVQARSLYLMEASPREREAGLHLDTISKIRKHPFSASYSIHGGLVFIGLTWIALDGAARNDAPLLLAAVAIPPLVELASVLCTIRRPAGYLLHRSVMFLTVLPLIGCTLAWWEVRGIANPLLTTPRDSWVILRLFPALVCIGYLIAACYNLAKHQRLIRERTPDTINNIDLPGRTS